ncbi:hypothetical protein CE91St58_64460 [Lachnospiraceae bacterium]|nr:hypothetical protein CE91St58_64460 [Lachnospiraceae bacterium]
MTAAGTKETVRNTPFLSPTAPNIGRPRKDAPGREHGRPGEAGAGTQTDASHNRNYYIANHKQ